MKQARVFETISNSYREIGQVGQGGAGIVLKVRDDDGTTLALKHIRPENVPSSKIQRFRNELEFCEKNSHRHIIKVIDHGFVMLGEMKCPFCVMPFYPTNLRQVMQDGMSHPALLHYYSQMLDGVEAAHLQGVWHRDLKPENILVDTATDALVVADWGIAHFAESLLATAVKTGPQERLANFQYAAPEQMQRGAEVDQRADIYALGLILNEMFTSKLAHGQGFERIAEVAPEFAYLDGLVDAMLSSSPDRRPTSIGEVKRELIARGNDFISQQKLSQLKQTVIPDTEVDDPLVLNPPELVEAEWDDGWLILRLNQDVNGDWAQCFHNPGGYSGVWGKGPDTFEISGNTARVRSDGSDAERLLPFAKQYVTMANRLYKEKTEAALVKRKADEERQLKEQIELQERRRAINAKLKI